MELSFIMAINVTYKSCYILFLIFNFIFNTETYILFIFTLKRENKNKIDHG